MAPLAFRFPNSRCSVEPSVFETVLPRLLIVIVQDVITRLTVVFTDLGDNGDLIEVSGQVGIVKKGRGRRSLGAPVKLSPLTLLGLTLVAALVVHAIGPSAAAAQDDTPVDSSGPIAIPVSSVSTRAQALAIFLAEATETGSRQSDIEEFEAALPDEASDTQESVGELAKELSASPTLEQLSDLNQAWSKRAERLEGWGERLEEQASQLAQRRESAEERLVAWQATADEARKEDAPEVARVTINKATADLKDLDAHLAKALSRILSLQQSVVSLQTITRDSLATIQHGIDTQRGDLFIRESAPLWVLASPSSTTSFFPPLQNVKSAMRSEFQVLVDYWKTAETHRSALLILLILCFSGALVARRRIASWDEDDIRHESSALLELRPYSTALVAALGAASLVAGAMPRSVENWMGLVILPPTLRILSVSVPENVQRTLPALALFYVLDRIRGLFVDFQGMDRLILLAESAAALGLLLWLLRPKRAVTDATAQTARPWLLRLATRLVLALLAASLLANVVGSVALSRLLGNGALASTYVGVALYGFFEAIAASLAFIVRSTPAGTSRAMAFHGDVVIQYGRRLLGAATSLVWLFATLDSFALRQPAWNGLNSILEAGITIGDFSHSIGDVGAFAVAVGIASYASKLVRFFLQVEIFPRVSLGRGLPNAISSMVHYGILISGLYIALAVAGVDLSQLTLLVGALGVGIGFGLQNVVNNFISGLILLFERPVQVGDTIDVANMVGRVRRIGIRSSTLRTFSGSEVIVPNSDLISNRVTNWTLSDPIRRIDLPIGVAYGTDPEQILAILMEIANQHERVQKSPVPEALFIGFGDSALNFELRIWLHFDDRFLVLSDVNVAINRTLKEHGIEIPFPQRDIHLRTVDPDAEIPAEEPAAPTKPPNPPKFSSGS